MTVADVALMSGENLARRAELDLVEVGGTDCHTPEELSSLIARRKPVATLAFAAQQNISNSQIAKFLESGADDFVYKNLDERILVAKIKAHLRRLAPHIAEAGSRLASSSEEIELDRARRTVIVGARSKKETELSNLTPREFDILLILVSHEKRVLSRDTILENLWEGKAAEVYSECVDKHIESLRKKLGAYGKKIKTVYGAGYMFSNGT